MPPCSAPLLRARWCRTRPGGTASRIASADLHGCSAPECGERGRRYAADRRLGARRGVVTDGSCPAQLAPAVQSTRFPARQRTGATTYYIRFSLCARKLGGARPCCALARRRRCRILATNCSRPGARSRWLRHCRRTLCCRPPAASSHRREMQMAMALRFGAPRQAPRRTPGSICLSTWRLPQEAARS